VCSAPRTLAAAPGPGAPPSRATHAHAPQPGRGG